MARSMKTMMMFVVAACGLVHSAATCGQTRARDYFNELYKAGGLDRMADAYVCFDDSSKLQTFFIYSRSETLLEFMRANGTLSKLSAAQRAALQKGFLIVRGYDKGVALREEETYSKDGDSWATDKFLVGDSKTAMRERLSITPETLRYKRTVEILNANSTLQSESSGYGRCETIPVDVIQKGN